MPKLIIQTRSGSLEVDLAEHNLVGRHSNNRIRLRDPGVSTVHCLIVHDPQRGYVIRDLGSLNGTFVNNRRIDGKHVLQDGDEIILGNTRCEYSKGMADSAVEMVDEGEGRFKTYISVQQPPKQASHFVPEQSIGDEAVLRSDYEKLRIVYELQQDFGIDLNLDTVLERILSRTLKFLNCQRGVFLMPDTDGELRPRVYKTLNPGDKFVISRTLIQHIRREKSAILSTDALFDHNYSGSESLSKTGTRSSLAVPILDQDVLMGILIVDSPHTGQPFFEKDLHLLSNVAIQTARFINNLEMAKKIENDAATRKRFQKLLSPDLAEMVVSGKLRVEKGGESRIATVLFADIRGFTAMSENTLATEVLQMLNDYFEVVVDIVFDHEGTVDKFIGDEMMVIWGAPVTHDDDPHRAVRAALDIHKSLIEFNRTRVSEGQPKIEVGIGISTGNLVAGYIGSSRTMSYSVIGDTVNTAHRLCSAAKAGNIIISEETYNAVADWFNIVEIESIPSKGNVRSIRAFKVLEEH